MLQLNYATCQSRDTATCIVFGANTQSAGTAPTFVNKNETNSEFSGNMIRVVDNHLPSLPENLKRGDQLWDDGNIQIPIQCSSKEINIVKSHLHHILTNKQIPICLGGDHLIKYASLAALDEYFPNEYGVIYIDAHPDCEPQTTINYSSILHHAFLLPHLKPKQIMLTGLRQFTISEANALVAYQGQIGVINGIDFSASSLKNMIEKIKIQFNGLKYIYFSIDLDGIDPCCAPAVESPYPGGPTLNQVLVLIHQLKKSFDYIGMDISEFIPHLDTQHMTALTAARLLKEFYSTIK